MLLVKDFDESKRFNSLEDLVFNEAIYRQPYQAAKIQTGSIFLILERNLQTPPAFAVSFARRVFQAYFSFQTLEYELRLYEQLKKELPLILIKCLQAHYASPW